MTNKKTDKHIKKAKNIIPAGRPGIPNPVDIHVGIKVRERRTLLGISQTQLADMLGITFQQVQKYERGKNRISCSRLVDLASVLDIEIDYFFDKIPDTVLKQSPRLRSGLNEKMPEIKGNPLVKRETLELVRVYYNINDQKKRQTIVNLCRSMADTENI